MKLKQKIRCWFNGHEYKQVYNDRVPDESTIIDSCIRCGTYFINTYHGKFSLSPTEGSLLVKHFKNLDDINKRRVVYSYPFYS